jgi:hypothetical protein
MTPIKCRLGVVSVCTPVSVGRQERVTWYSVRRVDKHINKVKTVSPALRRPKENGILVDADDHGREYDEPTTLHKQREIGNVAISAQWLYL